jgi:hypothetical protein
MNTERIVPKAEIKLKKKVERVEPDKEIEKPVGIGAVLELTVKDKDGNITDHRVLESKSFVRQFLELLYTQMGGVYYWKADQPYQHPYVIIVSTKGLKKAAFADDAIFDCSGAASDQNMGIMVGIGTTAPTIDDYALETRITHGTGAGQMQYGDVAFGLPTSDASTSHFTITRDFANASGGLITVSEIGLYVRCSVVNYSGYHEDDYFMIIRDVISGGIDVPDGQTLTVNYREQASV